MRQIPYVPLKNSKELAYKLNIAVGQRTEIAINIRTDDGMTNGASNVIKHVHLTNDSKPGLVWVQFDCDDVGRETRQENRNLYTGSIPNTWSSYRSLEYDTVHARRVELARRVDTAWILSYKSTHFV